MSRKQPNPPPPMLDMSLMTEKHLKLLGLKAKDVVTGFTGVITTISFDLYGCIQVIISPLADNGIIPDGQWFDVTRLIITGKKPVLTMPNFRKGYVAEGNKGGANKPLP